MGFGTNLQRHPLAYAQAVTFKPDNLFRIVGQQPYVSHAEVRKHLRAEAVIPQVGGKTELLVRFHRVVSFVLKGVCLQFIYKSYAPPFLEEVDKRPMAFLRDGLQGGVQLFAAVAVA